MIQAVVKVGGGRGFIIQYLKESLLVKGKRVFVYERLVVTAAHCLPSLRPWNAGSSYYERTYRGLLGRLDTSNPNVAAECLFADPIADIAVLGCPDREELEEQADAYDALTEAVPALRIGSAPREGRGWLLALDDQWVPLTIGSLNNRLWIEATEKNEPGVSGSPILADDGTAMAIVCVGRGVTSADGVRKAERSSPHPILLLSLPGWVLQRRTVARKRN